MREIRIGSEFFIHFLYLLRETDFLHQLLKPWVGAQGVKLRLNFKKCYTRATLVSVVQFRKRLILFAELNISSCQQPIVFLKRRVCCGRQSQVSDPTVFGKAFSKQHGVLRLSAQLKESCAFGDRIGVVFSYPIEFSERAMRARKSGIHFNRFLKLGE